MIYTPHSYQKFSEKHIMENTHCGLFLDMGLGKTVITLTAIRKLIRIGEISKVLIIAPLEVANTTWTDEACKWSHTAGLTFSKILGSPTQRKRALKNKADIYLINVENISWLVAYLKAAWPFHMIVVDELSMFKAHDSKRFKAIKIVRGKAKRILGLTGTPMPNGLPDLWPQLFILDGGERLGNTIGYFRSKYLDEGRKKGYVVYNYTMRKPEDERLGDDIYEKIIYDKIGDICISMKAEDYLDLPKRIDVDRFIELTPSVYHKYKAFEKEMVMQIADQDITAVNAAVLGQKLLQFANGALYDSDGEWHEVHKTKLKALGETIDAANGKNMLVFYWYKHDRERMLKYFRNENVAVIKGKDMVDKWNNGKINIGLAHPKSIGHGLNLQKGGHHSTWYSQLYSSELYRQGVKRLDRQGQTHAVINTRLIIKGTIDEKACKIIDGKTEREDGLMFAVKALIKEYTQQQ